MVNFAELSKRQLQVFEQIAVNNDNGHPQRTLDSLERRGYIIGQLQYLNGLPPRAVIRYSVPTPVHIAWRQWCASREEKE